MGIGCFPCQSAECWAADSSMRLTPMGWRPTRPPVGYMGSMSASSRAHGTHFREKLLAPRHALLLREFVAGKAQLLGRMWTMLHTDSRKQDSDRIDQCFPNNPRIKLEIPSYCYK